MTLDEIELIIEKEASLGDTLKSSFASAAGKLKDRGVAAAKGAFGGGQEAQGRLSTRIMADNMLKAWLLYKGATDMPANRKNVYRFLRKHYQGILSDPALRQITGMPPPPEPPQEPAAQQQAAGGDQQAGAAAQPDPNRGAPAAPAQPATPAPAQPAAQPAATNPPSPASPAATTTKPAQPVRYTKVVAAHIKSIYEKILDMLHPRGAGRRVGESRRPPPRVVLREAQETVASLVRELLDIGRRGDEDTKAAVIQCVANLKRNRYTYNHPAISDIPRGPEMFDPSVQPRDDGDDNATTKPAPATQQATAPQRTPQTPTQNPASNTAPQQQGIPFMITGRMKQQLGQLGYSADDIMGMTPQQANTIVTLNTRKQANAGATPPPPNQQGNNTGAAPPAPGQPAASPQTRATNTANNAQNPAASANAVNTVVQAIDRALQQGNASPAQVMQSLAQGLQATASNPAQRQRMIRFIQALKNSPRAVQMIPQLAQLGESAVLREAGDDNDPAAEPLSRSELHSIFLQTAQQLVANHAGGSDDDDDDDGDEHGSTEPGDGPDEDDEDDDDRSDGRVAGDRRDAEAHRIARVGYAELRTKMRSLANNRISTQTLTRAARTLRPYDAQNFQKIMQLYQDRLSKQPVVTLKDLLRVVEQSPLKRLLEEPIFMYTLYIAAASRPRGV